MSEVAPARISPDGISPDEISPDEVTPDLIAELYLRAEPYWHTRSGEVHMPQAYAYAQALLRAHPGAGAGTVLAAILLHDIGYARVPEETHHQGLADAPTGWRPDITRLHEQEGVRLARELLSELRYPAHLVGPVLTIIDGHDSRSGEAHSLEDALVKDADKLWRFGVQGVEICREWMGMSFEEFTAYVEGKIPTWFHTAEGARLARLTLERARREHGEKP